MSYILDALKKSDSERKRGDVPNLQTVHIPINADQPTPWALYGFISVLLLVLAFVIGLVISDKEPVTIIQVAETGRQIKPVLKPVLKEASRVNKNSELQYSKKIPQKITEQKTSQLKAARIEVTQKRAKEPVIELQQTNRVQVESVVALPDISNIPYLHELPEYQQQSVPEMHFAGHVYSTSAQSRSIIINNSAMSEGDTVVQGINVVKITSSGVVFSLHDNYFRMDILQDWSF
ncbi:MAG: hypothetical protein DIZ80_12160 [endosymbiont of Galathealinum brachiosum]|uniref:Type II secretion system protein GspB C-terminal domain-containing protein n=1 Tax=endosymbiont of Galathealinum brachiosum TaxID=2200906 RepID=A0A370DDM9_9GAMM|nr:MAG: hypothetical protein DIZ80_12160 [endosymbiont of Galathealinum brachiosum]